MGEKKCKEPTQLETGIRGPQALLQEREGIRRCRSHGQQYVVVPKETEKLRFWISWIVVDRKILMDKTFIQSQQERTYSTWRLCNHVLYLNCLKVFNSFCIPTFVYVCVCTCACTCKPMCMSFHVHVPCANRHCRTCHESQFYPSSTQSQWMRTLMSLPTETSH